MTKDEAMKLALEALENAPIEYDFHGNPMDVEFGKQLNAAITALRQALEQPEQEPVTWRNAAIRLGEDLYSVGPNGYYNMTASQWLDWALSVVNTASPNREWVGLTDEEIDYIWGVTKPDYEDLFDFPRAIESKLKEKNS